MSLDRFKIAQANAANGFNEALIELRNGRKVGHWIWYIFPQLQGLGSSPTARFYAIEGADEAQSYLQDPELRHRLLLVMQAVAKQLAGAVKLDELMGGTTDSAKVISCLTLFRDIAKEAGESPEIAEIGRIAQVILELGEGQGYPECVHTRRALGHSK